MMGVLICVVALAAAACDSRAKASDPAAARDYARLKSLTGASEDLLRAAQRLIRTLNPRPGAAFAKVEARYVIPDVIVRKVRGAWRASLNPDAMPRLRINRLYAEIAAGARSGASLSSQLQEARWLIKNVQQRFETILRVSQAIVERQRHFLEHFTAEPCHRGGVLFRAGGGQTERKQTTTGEPLRFRVGQ